MIKKAVTGEHVSVGWLFIIIEKKNIKKYSTSVVGAESSSTIQGLKKKFHTKCYFIRKDIIWSLRKQGKKICSSFVLGWSKSAMMYQCEPHGIVFGRKCSYKNKRQSLLYLWLIYTWFVVKKNKKKQVFFNFYDLDSYQHTCFIFILNFKGLHWSIYV